MPMIINLKSYEKPSLIIILMNVRTYHINFKPDRKKINPAELLYFVISFYTLSSSAVAAKCYVKR